MEKELSGSVSVDLDTAKHLTRQAEILESRLDHLTQTYHQTSEEMAPGQVKDLIEGLRDDALNHRVALSKALKGKGIP